MSDHHPSKSSVERPCVVGLTGGLASGKSTVARRLAAFGVPVIDADAVVGELYAPGEAGAEAVFDLFGASVLDHEGGVNRNSLAVMVLADDEKRFALEAAIHPLVRHRIQSWIENLEGDSMAVVEAALLVETGSYKQYEVLVVVWCDRQQQFDRAVSRGVPPDRAKGLLEAQLPLDAKRDVADVVIDNSGPKDDLETEINRAWETVRSLCAERSVQDGPKKFRIPNSEFRIP